MSQGEPNRQRQQTRENEDDAWAPEELQSLQAQLEEERKARAQVEAAIQERETQLAELQRALSEARQQSEALNAQLARSVSRYLEAVRAANPSIPPQAISGSTIEEIDQSLERALSIASAVRASLEAQAKETRIPAGAPPRVTISPEGLSPREKIALGIQQKGGIS